MKSYAGAILKLVEKKLWLKVIVSMILGLIIGIIINLFKEHISSENLLATANWLSFPGKLFIKLVQMIMIALIISSIITGIAGSTSEQLKTVGLKSVLYFVMTTTVAVIIGSFLTYLIAPGSYMPKGGFQGEIAVDNVMMNTTSFSFQNIPDLFLTLIPENPLESMLTGDMLSIVIFSIIIGIAIIQLDKGTSTSVVRLMEAMQKISMNIVNFAMKIVPYAVFGIMASLIITIGGDSLKGLGVYVATVLIGLLALVIFYLCIVAFVTRTNPFTFLANIKDAVLLAFSTTSSAAVMPLSLKVAKEKLKVRKNVSDIIIPLGTTINMDGTALYQCVSFIFVTQVYGLEMGFPLLMLSLVTIILASIGTPAVPGAGIIVLASVLQNAGLPAEGIMVIVGMERILGMFRSAVNVMGDLTACMVFNTITDAPVPDLELQTSDTI